VGGQPHKTPHYHPRHRHPPPRSDPPKKSLGLAQPPLHRHRTFPLMFVQWGMTSSVACECGAEDQPVDHVVLQCPIHGPSHGLHDLTVLDDETTEWLLNTCPEIKCGQAVDRTTSSKKEEIFKIKNLSDTSRRSFCIQPVAILEF